MKIIKGHLTEGNKKAIKAILDAGLTTGRVGRTDYHISKGENDIYTVKIVKKDRGLGFIGEPLRLSTNTYQFTL